MEEKNAKPLPEILVVGIAGGSGGGKTTLTSNLIRRFGDKVCIVHHDNYYRAHDDLTYEERTRLNYDCPEAFDTEMCIRDSSNCLHRCFSCHALCNVVV